MSLNANHCLAERVEMYSGSPVSPSRKILPYTMPVTREDAGAIAHDFADHILHETKEIHRVLDISGIFGPKYEIRGGSQSNYTLTTGLGEGIEEARGTVHISREILCRHPDEVLAEYSPKATLEAIAEANEIREMLGNRRRWAANIAIGAAEIAGFWPVAIAAASAAGYSMGGAEQIPVWASPIIVIGWVHSLFDGLYRIANNVSIWNSSILEKIERKKPGKNRQ